MTDSGSRAPASQSSVRAHNLSLALGVVARAPEAVSRADIAATTGMTRATASSLVDELLAHDLIRETGRAQRAGSGRPAIGLVVATTGPAGLGLEINVDYLGACLMDLSGEVRHRELVATDVRAMSPTEAATSLGGLAGKALSAGRRRGLRAVAASVAVAGLVDTVGMLRLAPNLGWRDVDLAALLRVQRALRGLDITVTNEANAAAIEHAALHPDNAHFLFVSGEIGIGAGIVIDGGLVSGPHGLAGELGHMPVRAQGRPCTCGGRGCLEQYAGMLAILEHCGLSALGPEAGVRAIVTAAHAHHAQTLGALRGAGQSLGIAVSAALNLLDLPTVVLGGSYGRLMPWIGPAMNKEISRRVLSSRWREVGVEAAEVGTDAAMRGAARSVVMAVLADPGDVIKRS